MTRLPSIHWSCAAALLVATACSDDGVPAAEESGDTTASGESDTIDTTISDTNATTIDTSGATAGDTTDASATAGDSDSSGGDSSSDSTGPAAECGNGLVEDGEDCDGTDLADGTCTTEGFDGGELACTTRCTFDTAACTSFTCGDGEINGAEACEAGDLGGATCEGAGFGAGEVTCTDGCELDFTGCCGDGTQGGAEICDGEDFGGQTCADFGPFQGSLTCSPTCDAVSTDACTSCGDGVIEGEEECEGDDLQDNDCTTIPGAFLGGTLSCGADCRYDTSECLACGNDIVDAGEDCDGEAFDGATCIDLGYTGGVLACTPQCGFDEAACSDLQTYDVAFCRVQFPIEIVESPGTEVTVYGRLYAGGLTDLSGVNDPAPAVFGQVGYGPDGSDPALTDGWVWTTAVPNDGYGPGSPGYEMNNDEAMATLVVPDLGTYDFAYRFTGNDGATWLYCDGGDAGSSDGYAPADAGQLTSE